MGLSKTFRKVKRRIRVKLHAIKAFRKKAVQDESAVTGNNLPEKTKEPGNEAQKLNSEPPTASFARVETTEPEAAEVENVLQEGPIIAMDVQEPVLRILNGNSIDTQWQGFINQATDLITNVVVSGQTVTWKTPRFFDSTFSTDRIQQAFEVPRVGDIDDDIVVGLQRAGNTANNISASSLLTAFDVKTEGAADVIRSILEAMSAGAAGLTPSFNVATADGLRNGSWIKILNPNAIEVTTALTWELSSGNVDLRSTQASIRDSNGLMVEESQLQFTSSNTPRLKLRLKHRAIITRAEDNSFSTVKLWEALVQIPVSGFIINLKGFSGGSLSASVLRPMGGGSLADLARLLSGGLSESTINPSDTSLFDNIELWKVSVQLPGRQLLTSEITFKIGFFVTLKFPGNPLTIGLSYNTENETFTGSLMLKSTYQSRLDPNFDELEDLPVGKLTTLPNPPDLRNSGPFTALPRFVPTKLETAQIIYTKGSDDAPYQLQVSASVVSDNASQPGGSVPFPFDWSRLSLDYFRQGAIPGESEGIDAVSLRTTFDLDSQSGKFQSGSIELGFTYSDSGANSSWTLAGSASYIQLGALASFFNPSMRSGVMDVLGKLTLESLDIVYTYTDAEPAEATSFLFAGVVAFGDLKLKLFYQYASKQSIEEKKTAADAHPDEEEKTRFKPLEPTEVDGNGVAWRFDAYLDVGTAGATIGTIADSIVDNASKTLPSFVRDIEIQPPAGSGDPHVISLHTGKASKGSGASATEGLIFLLNVSLSSVEFSFEQLSFTGAETKRLLRVSVGKLPLLSSLPVVKELPQPWSKLQYMWIPTGGFTRDEVTTLNQKLEIESSQNKLYFKPFTRDSVNNNAPDTEVLIGGHHFIVVVDNEAVLDHVFEPDLRPDPPTGTQPPGGEQPNQPDPPPQEKPPAKGAMTKQLGILDVSGLSLQYKQNRLYVFVDATLKLGPLSFSLIGFGIGLNISKLKLNDLSSLGQVADSIDFQLHGMEVAFDNPPILIAGAFYHDVFKRGDQTIDAYRGGIAVAIPPYTFVAVGEYAQVEEGGVQFKSVFIFAKLDGPIIDFQFAILRGLRIGFGVNSIVRSPAVEELHEFPFISNSASSGAGNHPMAILEKMSGGDNPWIQLKNEEYWLAFGFTISSFNLISATAVALVQFGNAGPVFRIFGDLTISYPPDDISATAKLFYIEVVMMAELNFAEDCFKLEAALAPSSFVFVPYCRLQGGLALHTYFGNSPHAGDWVFTVGGYHRAFQIPAHYPRAARLGLNFNVNIISIRGECYFAITPKAIMTGALIRCELHVGPVFAWLDAAFDAMVQFSPLHYWLSMGVEVGVECRVPVLFCTIRIRIAIGARLEIEGPDFGGTAYVDFWFFSFSFDFGGRSPTPSPIPLSEFYGLCEKSGPPDKSPNSSATEGLLVQLKISLEDGAFSMPSQDKEGQSNPDDTGAGTKWFVKGGTFQFRVSSVFALTEAYIETEESAQRADDGTTDLLKDQNIAVMQRVMPEDDSTIAPKLSSLPMKLSARPQDPDGDGITSKLLVAVQDQDPLGETVEGFKSDFVFKEMPLTLWADPEHAPDRLSQDKGTVALPMAITLSAPDPVLAKAKIPPFNATDMSKLCAGANLVPGLPAIAQFELLPDTLPTTDSTPTEKWAEMQQTWTDASTQNIPLANSLTDLCMSQLGWNKPRPDIAQKAELTNTEPWKVPVIFPTRLVVGTGQEADGIEDGLDSFYLELPRTTQSVVN